VCVCLIACDLETFKKKSGLGPIWAVAPKKKSQTVKQCDRQPTCKVWSGSGGSSSSSSSSSSNSSSSMGLKGYELDLTGLG